jgi:hypothetical protein
MTLRPGFHVRAEGFADIPDTARDRSALLIRN